LRQQDHRISNVSIGDLHLVKLQGLFAAEIDMAATFGQWTVAAFVIGDLLLAYLGFFGANSVTHVMILGTLAYGIVGSINAVLYLYTPVSECPGDFAGICNFIYRYDLSIDWLILGDIGGLLRMMVRWQGPSVGKGKR
jgi:hypothetical protein